MKKKVSTAILSAAAITTGATMPVLAADWDITPTLTLAEVWTDDVNLDSTFAQSEFVTQTTVGGIVTTAGPRINANINYALTHLFYPSLVGDKDEFRHNLLANSTTELARDFLFFDLNAGVNQQFADRRQAFSTVDITQTANRATVSIIDASPYTVNRINGNFAVLTTRYRFSYFDASRNITLNNIDFGDSTSTFHEGTITLASGTAFNRFTWEFYNQYRKQTITNGTDNDIYESSIDAEYQLNRKIALLGMFGYTKRNAGFGDAEFDGLIWNVGTRLTPGPRTVLEVRYGQEFFGRTYSVDGRYQITPNMVFTIRYDDRLQTFQSLILDDFQDGTGNDAQVDQLFTDGEFTRYKRWNAAIVGVRGRSTVTVNASYDISEGESIDRNYKRKALGVIWARQLSTRLTFNAGATLMEDDFQTQTQKDLFMAYEAGFDYQVSESITGRIEYIHTEREQALFNFVPRGSNFVRVQLGFVF